MEKDCKSTPQDTVDATPRDATGRESVPSAPTEEEGRVRRQASPRGGFEKFDRFESSKGCQSEQEGKRARANNPLEPLEPFEPLERASLEERVRRDCRRECRRNLFVELLKTVAKVAGVILAAMGLSSFNEED